MVGLPCYVLYSTVLDSMYRTEVPHARQPKGKCPELAAAFGTSWRIMPALGSGLISLSLSLLSLQRPPGTESRRTDKPASLVWSGLRSVVSGLLSPGSSGRVTFTVESYFQGTFVTNLHTGLCPCPELLLLSCCVGAIPCLRVRPPTLSRRHLEISTPSSNYAFAIAFNFTSSLNRSWRSSPPPSITTSQC